jgi:hypothetical protein
LTKEKDYGISSYTKLQEDVMVEFHTPTVLKAIGAVSFSTICFTIGQYL